ncbi:alpha/beta hydrolase [Planctomyces sp. SH-PL62]|uniref:alpha/beta hydrolase n=1 Tax=Planctomyces sp. SH-PL62 TaxID=1636152 RepID=UPI00078E86E8|nr:esterase [Planctomyces sp. SH-PL62]AMV37186.1 Carboxylesterase 2 [Planctomyces sp. SH-PL62]
MAQDRTDAHGSSTASRIGALTDARFVPRQYEPNYAYPLLVLLHGKGGDEDQLIRAMPALSRQNYVGLGLRGPVPVVKRERLVGYSWGSEFEIPERCSFRQGPALREADRFRRAMCEPELDPITRLEEGVFASVREARSHLHVHSERIFLVGCGEGAAAAYRLGLSFPDRFAGVVAINGWLPGEFRPLARFDACRDFPVLVVHGAWNARVPLSRARREVGTLRAAGLRVAFQSYPCNHRLDSDMLADVDNWLMTRCTGNPAV